MVTMFQEAGIDTIGRQISNHSGKVTLCTELYNAGYDEQTICSRSGHRSTAVRTYKRLQNAIKLAVSNTLQAPKSVNTKTVHSTTSICKKENTHVMPGMFDLQTVLQAVKKSGGGRVTVTGKDGESFVIDM